jgi:shikimate kinase/3-dehydroquinate synthase
MASPLTAPKSDAAIVVVGLDGAATSAAARALATAQRRVAIDAGALVEQRFAHAAADAPAAGHEAAFRALEERVVCELLDNAATDDVISLGGDAVASERVRKALSRHVVVWLDVDPAVAGRRRGPGKRAPAGERKAFEALHAARRPLYEALADAIVPAGSGRSIAGAYDSLASLRHAPAGTRLLWAVSASREYPVWVGRGLIGSSIWPIARPPSRRFLVSDDNVAGLWAGRLGEIDGELAIRPGEASKTLACAQQVWHALVSAGITRSDHIAALGGGVVGDLAGFCAATYQRGIDVVQVPTTLVAQVDSAYGGKTGVDLPEAKNYVGAFHQPAGVIVDPAALDTLPAGELSAGYAELLKTALIAGGTLWQRVAADAPLDEQVIFDCIRCKLAVVAADERDGGARQVLNLGHTVGHAIETATGYGRYRHGEAVALGMLVALRLSGQEELRTQVRLLLDAHGLPTTARGLDATAVLAATRLDKKRGPHGVPMVLVEEPGRVRHGAAVADAELERAVLEVVG